LLVPFPQAADDHQLRNAEVLAKAGAAVVLLQREVTDESLLRELVDLFQDAPRRAEMAEQARSLAKPGALQRIAAIVLRLAAGK
jgi:UDP-N-acetylglucosamine--N-acetylmuramyl-(pentapeptide) pyrophosphoryl-undecaprenol N-acetylglucosamine transferase